MSWEEAILLARPEGNNDNNENKGGLVIYIKAGAYGGEEEVGRVAFDRAEGSDSETPFNEKVDEVVGMARKSIEVIKELHAQAGQLQ